MFKKMNLQTRLISAFILMGLIVLVVAWMGWSGTSRLSTHINTLTTDTIPSINGLWKVNEGQTQIQSSERALLNTLLSKEDKENELTRIKQAWKQIDEGFKQYEATPRITEEDRQYKKYLQEWETWKQDHQKFIALYQDFEELGILDPANLIIDLLSQGKSNDPRMVIAKKADTMLDRMSELAANQELRSFKTSEQTALEIIEINQDFAAEVKKKADSDISQTTFWVFIGMTIGPVTAIVLGVILSIAIAKPLDKAIGGIVNVLVSSATEIAATVEQQERIATHQAASVNQTTTTMDELGASSQQSAEQAESAANNARQVLQLAEQGTQGAAQASNLATEGTKAANQVLQLADEGNKVVEKTLDGMFVLKEKVAAIAEQITRLNDQAEQIGSITSAVSDIANQTNMLALNAAVEAVRAGEHGKGFGVVAGEIRRLADQSKKSAEKINGIIGEIQNAIVSTVAVTDEGTKTVNEGTKLSQQTAEAFKGVAQAINDIVLKNQDMMLTAINEIVLKNQEKTLTAVNDIAIKNQQIALTAKQQAVAVQQVVEAMNAINIGSKQTASGISQTKVGVQQLNQAAMNLKSLSVS